MKFLYSIFHATASSVLVIIIAFVLGELFGFAISDFWQGYLIATGSYFGIDFYIAKHYKLIKRQREMNGISMITTARILNSASTLSTILNRITLNLINWRCPNETLHKRHTKPRFL